MTVPFPPVVWAGWEVAVRGWPQLIMLSQVASAVRGEGIADGVERSASVVAGADQIGPDPTMPLQGGQGAPAALDLPVVPGRDRLVEIATATPRS